ncbi:MAG: DUF4276 family protein [Gemmataceae bacterium]
MRLHVVVIVEGHGDSAAIRLLLERIWYEELGGEFIKVVPWRATQGEIRHPDLSRRVFEAASIKLHANRTNEDRRLLLILMDSEGEECPLEAAPEYIRRANVVRSDMEVACVLANPMFETWFAAAADSLRGINGLPQDLEKPEDPEGNQLGKRWVKASLCRKYKERHDQPAFVRSMSLSECRASSRSFRKLFDELKRRI